MKTYHPPEVPDDVDHLKDAIARRVNPGDDVHVSLGGMNIGKVENAHAKPAEQVEKSIIFTTDPDLLKSVASDIDLLNDDDASLLDLIQEPPPPYSIDFGGITFHGRNQIETPAELSGYEDSIRWSIALHEVGHGIAAFLTEGACVGVGLESLADGTAGICYDDAPEGSDRYMIFIGGAACQSLGRDGSRLDLDHPDYINARNNLRLKGLAESDIPGRIADDVVRAADEFNRRWRGGILTLTTELCKRSWLSDEQFSRLLGIGQARLTKAGVIQHKNEDVLRFKPMAKSVTNFDRLQASIEHAGSQIDLDAAKGAHAVAVAETRRNHAAVALAAMKGQP